MTIPQLRAAHAAAPFRPFTMLMADGRSFRVPHPEFLFLPAKGRTVIVYRDGEEFDILDSLLVAEIRVDQAAAPRS